MLRLRLRPGLGLRLRLGRGGRAWVFEVVQVRLSGEQLKESGGVG